MKMKAAEEALEEKQKVKMCFFYIGSCACNIMQSSPYPCACGVKAWVLVKR